MDWLAAALLAAAVAVAIGLLLLLRRLTPEAPLEEPTPLRTRAGTIPMVRCYDCGELVERHRAVLSGAVWFCRDPEQCPPSDASAS